MIFQPALGAGGLSGWRVLERTSASQQQTFEKSPVLQRNINYFQENISKITSAEDLVKDYRLLTVALGAFGLGDEINKRALVQKMLEGGTEKSDSLANRFNDNRYKALVKAFGFGNITNGSSVLLSSFKEDIITRYKSLEFERAVGETDNDMRIAMNFKRQIGAIAESQSSERTLWFQVMGQLPLRELISTALNIPSGVAQLNIDRQAEIFSDRAQQLLGNSSPEVFSDPEVVDNMIRRFFLFRQVENGPSVTTPGFAALSLLQSNGFGAAANINLILSQL
ncbi:MAG: DUF1217 domain-containing protein [Marinicaulis sp.]|nr:DUF1217 domain-containing protein [Marinicaulis sp.]